MIHSFAGSRCQAWEPRLELGMTITFTVRSPQDRIRQIEYVIEVIKQGSATVSPKSKTRAVLVALKRVESEKNSLCGQPY